MTTKTTRAMDLTATKKTTSKNDHNHQLGHLIDGDGGRDAIHIAILPATAGERLAPGQHVGIKDGHARLHGVERVGIVDPFLAKNIECGERFYVCLYPNTITSLRHVWTHDLIDAEAPAVDPKAEATAWLRDFADRVGLSYSATLSAISNYASHGDIHVFYGTDTPDFIYSERELMWKHYETLTGSTVPDERRDYIPFSCSC